MAKAKKSKANRKMNAYQSKAPSKNKKYKYRKKAAIKSPKNEFWKLNALITAEIEKIGAGISRQETVSIDSGKNSKPISLAQSMVRNKVGFELKILETEIKAGRQKMPREKEDEIELESDDEGEED